jgi:hypothetical protein
MPHNIPHVYDLIKNEQIKILELSNFSRNSKMHYPEIDRDILKSEERLIKLLEIRDEYSEMLSDIPEFCDCEICSTKRKSED